jgi:hypothetical protein
VAHEVQNNSETLPHQSFRGILPIATYLRNFGGDEKTRRRYLKPARNVGKLRRPVMGAIDFDSVELCSRDTRQVSILQDRNWSSIRNRQKRAFPKRMVGSLV